MHIKDFDPYDFSTNKVEGVTVYYKNLPWSPSINIRLVINTAGFNDPKGKEGLSHFLEHMIFNGSPLLENKKIIREWSKKNTLNSFNAWTSFYNTAFTLRTLPENFSATLEGLMDVVFNPLLRPEDVEHERKVITQEAWGRFQNEKFLVYSKKSLEIMYPGHSHKHIYSPLGWPETIQKISQEDIALWHKNNFVKENMFVIMTGAVEAAHIEALSTYFKTIPVRSESIPIVSKTIKESFLPPTTPKTTVSADEIGEVKEQVEISFVRIGEHLDLEKHDTYMLFKRLMHDILNERLRIDHSLCYGVSVVMNNEKTYSMSGVNVMTEEKNIELVQKEFWNIIEELKTPLHKDRFESLKQIDLEQTKSAELMSEQIANDMVKELFKFNGRMTTLQEQINYIQKTTFDDMQKIAVWAFDPMFLYTEIILPSKKD